MNSQEIISHLKITKDKFHRILCDAYFKNPKQHLKKKKHIKIQNKHLRIRKDFIQN